MVTICLNKHGVNGHILLEPNLSLGWKDNINLFSIFALIILVTAIFFSLNGKWLVLPFSGLELIVIFIALYTFFRRARYQEVIRFTQDKVIIEQGRNSAESTQCYKRLWSNFYIDKPNNMATPKIFIRSYNQETEIGTFLNYDDKQKLIQALKKITVEFKNQFCEK